MAKRDRGHMVIDVYTSEDIKNWLEKTKNEEIHSRWIIFEAGWCPMSKAGIVNLKDTLD